MNALIPLSRMRVSRIAAACLCAFLLSACDKSLPPDQLVSEARAAIARNDLQTASIQLKNALQQDANFGPARFELGKVNLRLGDTAAAVKELQRAMDLNHDASEVAPLLARAMVEAGSYADVISRFASLELPVPAADSELKAALGHAYMATRNLEGAVKAFDQAIALDPGNTYASVGKARLLAVSKDVESGRALLDKVLATGTADDGAWYLDAELKAATGDLDAAIQSFRKVYELEPENVRSRFIVIATLADQNKLGEARQELAALKKAVPKAPEAMYLDGLLLLKERKFPEAREALNKVLAIAPNYLPALGLAAVTELELKSYTVAEQHAEKVLANGGDSLAVRQVLIKSYLASGRVTKAQQTLEPLLKKLPTNLDVQSLAGQVYLTAGDAEAAERAFAAAVKLKPEDPVAQSRLGLSRLAAGDKSGGIDALEAAVRLQPDDTRADVLLIVAYFRNKDADRALAAIDALEKKKPGDPMTPNLRGTAYLIKRDQVRARESFSRALEIDPAFFPAASNLARMDWLAGNKDAAEARFRAVLDKAPRHPDALMALAGLKAQEKGDKAAAEGLLQQAIKGNPGLVAPHVAMVQLLASTGDSKKALAAATEAAAAFPDDMQVLEVLASAQASANQLDAAIATRTRMVERDAGSTRPLLRLAAVQMLARRDAEALQNVRKALSMEPELVAAQEMMVGIHLSRSAFDDAIKVARDVQKQKPRQAIGHLLEGDVWVRAGKSGSAVKPYREALSREKAPRNVIRLHSALEQSGDSAAAQAVVAEWTKEFPTDNAVLLYLAESALSAKRYDEARRRYEGLVRRAPNDVVVLNNLAWITAQAKERIAMDYAAKAYSLAPQSPAVLDTYGTILFDNGETERGLTMLKQAVAAAPAAHDLRFNLAQRLVKAGMKAEARRELEQLTALGDKFARSAEVSELMKNL